MSRATNFSRALDHVDVELKNCVKHGDFTNRYIIYLILYENTQQCVTYCFSSIYIICVLDYEYQFTPGHYSISLLLLLTIHELINQYERLKKYIKITKYQQSV